METVIASGTIQTRIPFVSTATAILKGSLREFVLALAQLIKEYAGLSDIDDLDLRKFAVKHFKAAMKVDTELAKLS
jgi:hypothetical protein